MEAIDEDIEKWKYLIGSIILKFGEIELATYQLWVYYGQKAVDAPKNFGERNGKVIGLISRDTNLNASEKEFLKNYFIQAGQFAETRNVVAHNPFQINIYQHSKSGDYFEYVEINSVLENRIISFDELAEFLEKIEILAEKIYSVIPLPLMLPD